MYHRKKGFPHKWWVIGIIRMRFHRWDDTKALLACLSFLSSSGEFERSQLFPSGLKKKLSDLLQIWNIEVSFSFISQQLLLVVWLQIWSTIFLLLTAVLPLAAVIIVLLITWGISINSSVAQERERNTLGEMFCLLNPELQLFSDSLCLLSPPYCLISFNLGFYNADQVKANLKQCLFSNIVQSIYFSHVIIWV